MTSQVNPNNIDGTYPVAGQDNDSQGFRDNFTNIRNNFTFTKAEIEDLQNKVVLKSALLNTTLSNDFAGNAMVNPALTSWRETYNNIGVVGATAIINFTNGNYQKITMSASTILTFSFPNNTNNQYASIKLWVSNPSASYTLSFPNTLTLGDTDTIAGFSGNTVTFSSAEISNSTDYFFEIFTFDAGTTLGIRDLGRNRTKALSGLQVSGNLTAGANLITNAGTINTNYAYVTLIDSQNFFANTGYNTLYFDTSSSTTIANARIALPDTDVDGREITLSFLAPITAVWVNKGNTALVKWFPNTTVSSGNVVAKFTYSVANSNWLRS
jgi:hypothetical protein